MKETRSLSMSMFYILIGSILGATIVLILKNIL